MLEELSTSSWQSTDKHVVHERARDEKYHRQLEYESQGPTHTRPSADLTGHAFASTAESSFASCEDILKWPVFGEGLHLEKIEALFTDPMLANDVADDQSMTGGELQALNIGKQKVVDYDPDFFENDAPSLVEYFLIQVHIKNPNLDPTSLRKMASNVAKYGLKWDGSTCLVVRDSFPSVRAPLTYI